MLFLATLTFMMLAVLSTATAAPAERFHRAFTSSNSAAFLSSHNDIRAAHGADPLTWSHSLAANARTWANQCQFTSSGGSLSDVPYGENFAAGTGSFPIEAAVGTFVADEGDYDASHPTYNHFTQVVWKSTTQLGCAVAQCDGIVDPKYGQASFYVCLYNPAGNIVGEATANVQV